MNQQPSRLLSDAELLIHGILTIYAFIIQKKYVLKILKTRHPHYLYINKLLYVRLYKAT